MLLRLLVLTFALLTVYRASGTALAQDSAYTRLVNEAILAQQEGAFARARQLFAEAHTLEPNARTLRGMGVSAFQAGDLRQAVVDLSASLEHPIKPLDDELRAAVMALLAEAQARLNASAPAIVQPAPLPAAAPVGPVPMSAPPTATPLLELAVSPLPPTRDDAPAEDPRRRGMWGSLSAGGALAVAAGSLWVAGSVRASSIEDACGTACTDAFVRKQVEQAHLHEIERAFNATAVASAAAFAASLGLWIWTRHSPRGSSQLTLGDRSVLYTQHF
ncbi:MAG: hypothetical protein QM778_23740 [Myxococcales bacterium]